MDSNCTISSKKSPHLPHYLLYLSADSSLFLKAWTDPRSGVSPCRQRCARVLRLLTVLCASTAEPHELKVQDMQVFFKQASFCSPQLLGREPGRMQLCWTIRSFFFFRWKEHRWDRQTMADTTILPHECIICICKKSATLRPERGAEVEGRNLLLKTSYRVRTHFHHFTEYLSHTFADAWLFECSCFQKKADRAPPRAEIVWFLPKLSRLAA